MPDVLAAIAITQMKIYKSEILTKRKKIFDAYNDFFLQKDWALIPPSADENRESSYHVYLLRIKNITEETRDKIMGEIYKNNVAVNVHFQPLPILSLFKEKGYKIENYPVSYKNYAGEISLPIYPQLSDEDVKTVCKAVESAYNKVIS
jgi:dTDP-4-amino-4,6-dideoxygalactose transaminase